MVYANNMGIAIWLLWLLWPLTQLSLYRFSLGLDLTPFTFNESLGLAFHAMPGRGDGLLYRTGLV